MTKKITRNLKCRITFSLLCYVMLCYYFMFIMFDVYVYVLLCFIPEISLSIYSTDMYRIYSEKKGKPQKTRNMKDFR